MEKWFVYIVQCADDSFYTGITNNLERRIERHNLGRGAKYTRTRRPVVLVYNECYDSRAQASRKEIEIKKLGRSGKQKIVSAGFPRPQASGLPSVANPVSR